MFSDKVKLKALVTGRPAHKCICWQQTCTVRNARNYLDGREIIPDGIGIPINK